MLRSKSMPSNRFFSSVYSVWSCMHFEIKGFSARPWMLLSRWAKLLVELRLIPEVPTESKMKIFRLLHAVISRIFSSICFGPGSTHTERTCIQVRKLITFKTPRSTWEAPKMPTLEKHQGLLPGGFSRSAELQSAGAHQNSIDGNFNQLKGGLFICGRVPK